MNDFKKKGGYSGSGGRDNRGAFPPRGGNYSRPSYGGDRGGFNRAPAGAGSFGRSTELFDAICADCGKSCQVPFKPNGKKPVYCKECFSRNEGGGESGSRPVRDFSAAARPIAPFKPAPAPVSDKRIDDLKIQLDSVNYKLEKLIKMIEGSKAEAPKPTPAPIKAEAAKVVAPVIKTEAKAAPAKVAPAKTVKAVAKKSAPKKK